MRAELAPSEIPEVCVSHPESAATQVDTRPATRPATQPAEPLLVGRYPWLVAVVLLALVPNIVIATAYPLLQTQIASTVHISRVMLATSEGLSNAGYAFGAVLGAYLTQKFLQRPLFLATQSLFVAGSALATLAWTAAPYAVGRIIQGFATGLMLVVALPPLVTRFGVDKLPRTATAINIGLFGAVTAGPTLAGATATVSWRVLFATATAGAAIGLLIAHLALPRDVGAFDRSRRADHRAFILSLASTVLPFFAAAQLVEANLGDPIVAVPLGIGLVLIAVLCVEQYRKPDPLMPVRALSTSFPVIGTLAAMVGGAGFVTFVELTTTYLMRAHHESPLHVGELFAPTVAGLAIAATIYAFVLRTRYLAIFVFAGMVLIVTAGLVLVFDMSDAAVLASSVLLGAGAGATVSPGLFLAAFGVVSSKLGRAFALVELVRSEANFLIAPILLWVAVSSTQIGEGVQLATAITVVLTSVGTAALVALFVASGAKLQKPNFDGWLNRDELAVESPQTAHRLPVRANANR